MRHNSCKYGNDCKYYHPKKLSKCKETNEVKPVQKYDEEKISYAKIAARNLQPQETLLRYPANQSFIGQASQPQYPFLEQCPIIQKPPISDIQSTQKQIMNLLTNLTQRMTNLEMTKIQV